MNKQHLLLVGCLGLSSLLPILTLAQIRRGADMDFIRQNFDKREVSIPMRDGKKMYTVIYMPKDHSHPYPFPGWKGLRIRPALMETPLHRGSLGPNRTLSCMSSISSHQDVRGRFMSEGNFREMTPSRDNPQNELSPEKKLAGAGLETDESSDTWDTVDWLLKNVTNNNGRVGIYGISYPGFYASASLPDAHPAVKAVSPQAPVTDEFIGDDVNHNGAFFLLDNFDFDNFFDVKRPEPVKNYGGNIFRASYEDAYRFFLDLGPLKNSNKPEYFNNQGKIWNEYLGHSTYDAYWQARKHPDPPEKDPPGRTGRRRLVRRGGYVWLLTNL